MLRGPGGRVRAPDGTVVPATPGPWLPVLLDWGPVVTVALVSQTGVGQERPWTGSDLELALTGLAAALPLGWRRTRPVQAAVFVGLALCAQVLLVGGSLHFGSFAAVLIAMYSVARHEPGRRTAVAGGLLLAAGVAAATAEELRMTPTDVVFPAFYLSAAWLVGRGMRRQEQRAHHLSRLNDALRRERESAARLAVAEERLRLARELHDVVAHTVMLMVVQAEAAEETLGSDTDATRRSLRTIQDAGRRGMGDLRDLVGVLREPGEDAMPVGMTTLDTLRERMLASGLAVSISHEGDTAPLQPAAQATLYRLVQEALTNVLKHSSATVATVDLAVSGDLLKVTVTDPGPARERPRGPGGHGLEGMRERVAQHRGRLEAGALDGGFRVRAELPVGTARS